MPMRHWRISALCQLQLWDSKLDLSSEMCSKQVCLNLATRNMLPKLVFLNLTYARLMTQTTATVDNNAIFTAIYYEYSTRYSCIILYTAYRLKNKFCKNNFSMPKHFSQTTSRATGSERASEVPCAAASAWIRQTVDRTQIWSTRINRLRQVNDHGV